MSEWRRGNIGELAKGHRGVSYAAGQLREFKSPDTITLLRSNNISSGRLIFDDVQIVPSRLVSEDQLLRPGDIAVCMSNGSKTLAGKAAPFLGSESERFTVGAFCSVFRPTDVGEAAFVSFVFQSKEYRRNLDLSLAGTAINNLRNADVEAFGCDIPPHGERSKIGHILDTLDTAIHETEAIIAKLKAVKQGLLHDLLTRGIAANGELRPPQAEAPHLYKESPLGWIPKEWNFDLIGNLTTSSVIGPFGSDLVASDYRESGVPVIFVRDVKPDCLIWKSNVYVSPAKAQALAAHEVRAGDIVATKMGLPPCVSAVYPDKMPNGVVTADIVRLRPDLSRIRPNWMAAFINSPAVAKQVEQITAGVTRPKVTLRDVRNLRLAVPSLEEQQLILGQVDAMEARIRLEDAAVQKFFLEKSGFMDDLLTGRVRVTPLLEAVAP